MMNTRFIIICFVKKLKHNEFNTLIISSLPEYDITINKQFKDYYEINRCKFFHPDSTWQNKNYLSTTNYDTKK